MFTQRAASADAKAEFCVARIETVRNGALRNEARQQGQASEDLECCTRE